MELIIMKLFIIILDYNFFSKLQISHCHILWLPTILLNFVCKRRFSKSDQFHFLLFWWSCSKHFSRKPDNC